MTTQEREAGRIEDQIDRADAAIERSRELAEENERLRELIGDVAEWIRDGVPAEQANLFLLRIRAALQEAHP